MAADDCAIFVAIDDNHQAWYEMLVPFVLSLRRTDYRGYVVVLDYGMSERKRAILEREAIIVAPALTGHELSYGRYIEVARICAGNPNLAKAALYDADIWFCAEMFDLFAHVRDERLYVCPDPMLSSFIDAPLIGPRRGENARKVHGEILARYGGALQAGLVAAPVATWAAFARHLEDCAGRIGTDFTPCFGIDTTFLHLWAAEHEVALLPETQNFITKRGVAETFDPARRQPIWEMAGETIRAMHMCGDVRFYDRWRFYANHCEHGLHEGARFALAEGAMHPVAPAHGIAPETATDLLAAAGLGVVSLEAEIRDGCAVRVFRSGAGLFVQGCGNHRIVLEALRDIPRIDCIMSYPAGLPSPIRRTITIAGQDFRSFNQLATNLTVILARGATLTLTSESLGGQACEATWILSDDTRRVEAGP